MPYAHYPPDNPMVGYTPKTGKQKDREFVKQNNYSLSKEHRLIASIREQQKEAREEVVQHYRDTHTEL